MLGLSGTGRAGGGVVVIIGCRDDVVDVGEAEFMGALIGRSGGTANDMAGRGVRVESWWAQEFGRAEMDEVLGLATVQCIAEGGLYGSGDGQLYGSHAEDAKELKDRMRAAVKVARETEGRSLAVNAESAATEAERAAIAQRYEAAKAAVSSGAAKEKVERLRARLKSDIRGAEALCGHPLVAGLVCMVQADESGNLQWPMVDALTRHMQMRTEGQEVSDHRPNLPCKMIDMLQVAAAVVARGGVGQEELARLGALRRALALRLEAGGGSLGRVEDVLAVMCELDTLHAPSSGGVLDDALKERLEAMLKALPLRVTSGRLGAPIAFRHKQFQEMEVACELHERVGRTLEIIWAGGGGRMSQRFAVLRLLREVHTLASMERRESFVRQCRELFSQPGVRGHLSAAEKRGDVVTVWVQGSGELSGETLGGCEVEGANVSGTIVQGCDMRGLRMRGWTLTNCTMEGCDLSGEETEIVDEVGVFTMRGGEELSKRFKAFGMLGNCTYASVKMDEGERHDDKKHGRGKDTCDNWSIKMTRSMGK